MGQTSTQTEIIWVQLQILNCKTLLAAFDKPSINIDYLHNFYQSHAYKLTNTFVSQVISTLATLTEPVSPFDPHNVDFPHTSRRQLRDTFIDISAF